MHFKQLASLLNAQVLQAPQGNPQVLHLLTDSRRMVFAEEGIFIALMGQRHNGHQYLTEVYNQGVRLFLLQEGAFDSMLLNKLPGAGILVTPNTLAALQKIAAAKRREFHYPLTAITGSNGKTVVKEWLSHLLKEEFNVVRNPKSYNSQIGVPLSVWQMQASHEYAFFEAGISEPKEMQQLEEILKPTQGIFTFLGTAHDEGFSNTSEKVKEKLKLFQGCKRIIYPQEQSLLHELIQQEADPQRFKGWSRVNPQAAFFISVRTENQETHLTLNKQTVRIPFTDEASVWNACTCLAWLAENGLNQENILSRFIELPALELRLQLKEAQQQCLLINDAYSADTGSLSIALDFLQQHARDRRRTVILSDFLESGQADEALYAQIAQQLKACGIQKFLGIGKHISKHADTFLIEEKYFYPSTEAFLAQAIQHQFSHEIILLKGARKFGFERIGKLLEKQVHQTVFEINLNALVHNLNAYKSLLKPGVKVMAMVKAFSYGAGSYEIARVLAYNRVDYLTVAYADEGVVLREAGIQTPIMVMNPEHNSFDAVFKYRLEPEIYHFEILQALIEAADGEEVGIHIELDTGMKRLGFDAKELDALIELLKANPHIRLNSVFTHLAASDEEEHDAFTLAQITRFEEMSKQLVAAFPYPVLRHCLNSGGISRFAHAQFDMVRLGIGLYGIDPGNHKQLNLQPIGALKTIVSQIREIGIEESIGYGRKGKLANGGKIAIVAIGYADGLDRKLSNGVGYMLVNGTPAPIVGNICMDMTMLDVTDVACKVGDRVTVFGEQPGIHELSARIGTIPYEILTGVSRRVKRVYYYE